ncbi:pyruvate dehydrogenase E1 component alpha subunit [Mycoplasma testudineum]|uniref:Pyruvate dehydrogenase E1 component subunit alpha n=1 Tax=Mycoplasma testudineum TaxID=244584 RepID=A0A4R6IDW9_9MOLU|nr:pyruvate dehydrogenase (acetyl-transferring) E1 component subunit alpha [Mycoplasma testudineum]OYD26771.1 pyruvate dehydrogenase (acetyl-transferring) E1 component subunit alpha [Mycoplasma testudineum]TDO19906.1 pyruvate dehydrogenase E1 component alpha subunit [Mycoplasma testudineum]
MNKNFKYVNPEKVMDKETDLVRYLDKDGNLTPEGKKNKTTLSNEELIRGYEFMVRSREMDKYMTQLQKQGRMLTFAPNFGEEGLQVATAMAMDPKIDWMVPAFRSNATMLMLGVPMVHNMVYWNGSEEGSRIPEGVNVTPIAITIGAQYSHAAGISYGMKLEKKANPKSKQAVAVTIVGNGGTAEGETYEAMNMASIQEWPAIFTVNNNQWAISTPGHLESKAVIAAKAHAAGIAGVRVDGNDLLASYEVMKEAIDYARETSKPVLVEFVTWRQGVHTSSDNPRVYRTEEVEKKMEEWEPFHRIEKYLIDNKIYSKKQQEEFLLKAQEEVKAAYEESLKVIEKIEPTEIFDHTYATLTPELKEQRDKMLAEIKGAK